MASKLDTAIKSKTIQVRISDFEHGLQVFDDVEMIRIISKDYNLLIMNDFVSTVGSIDGSVELVRNKQVQTISNIHAYYLNRKNVFSLLIDENQKGTNESSNN